MGRVWGRWTPEQRNLAVEVIAERPSWVLVAEAWRVGGVRLWFRVLLCRVLTR